MDIYNELSQLKQIQQETLNLLKEHHNNGVVNNQDKVYDFTDLEKLLNVSRRTLQNWKSDGLMKFTEVGKKRYITSSELKRFLEANKQD